MSTDIAPRDANHIPSLIVEDVDSADTPLAVTGDTLTSAKPMHVAVVDGTGAQITSFGGGTQYTEGDTDTTITGTAALAEGASNTLQVLQVDASKHLQVDIAASSVTVTVDGSGVTQPVSHAALTELAAAINASSQMDVNIAASAATVPVSHAALTELAAAIDTEVQVDIVGSLPAGTATIGKLAANSGVDIGDVDVTSIATGSNIIGRVGHDVTGIGHGVTTVTTAGTDVVLAGSTACKRVTIQAQTDNTGLIAVGATGVDATVATGTGVLLYPGDSYEIDIDNLADIFIDSTVSGEGVRYSYLT